ncbi:MAG: putative YigZ family protein [Polaribacter sp.]|jgi:uncharacterized YigZ family protein
MDSYSVPASTQTFELEIKRSRFITSVGRINGRADGKQFVQQIRTKHPTASHHCWAYMAGKPDDAHQYNQSDDGEPKGTAGKPMLNVLTHSGLGNTIAVVTRYYGGIKLGSGGLVRAYSQSVSEALKQLQTSEQLVTSPLAIRFPYTYQGKIDHYLISQGVSIIGQSFEADVSYTLDVPVSKLELTKTDIANQTQGQVKIEH